VVGGTPPYKYSWMPEFIFNNPYIANPILIVDASRQIVVSVIDSSGCRTVDSVSIVAANLHGIRLTGPEIVCYNQNEVVNIIAEDCLDSIVWKIDDVEIENKSNELVLKGLIPGKHEIIASGWCLDGCGGSDTINVEVHQVEIRIGALETYFCNSRACVQAFPIKGEPRSILWQLSTGVEKTIFSDLFSPICFENLPFGENIEFTAIARDSFGCADSIRKVTIKIDAPCCSDYQVDSPSNMKVCMQSSIENTELCAGNVKISHFRNCNISPCIDLMNQADQTQVLETADNMPDYAVPLDNAYQGYPYIHKIEAVNSTGSTIKVVTYPVRCRFFVPDSIIDKQLEIFVLDTIINQWVLAENTGQDSISLWLETNLLGKIYRICAIQPFKEPIYGFASVLTSFNKDKFYVGYYLYEDCNMELSMYDLQGRQIRSEFISAGSDPGGIGNLDGVFNVVPIAKFSPGLGRLARGVYFINLTAMSIDQTRVKKIISKILIID
jgi:hypothetical protein